MHSLTYPQSPSNGQAAALDAVARSSQAGIRRRIPGHAEKVTAAQDTQEKPVANMLGSFAKFLAIGTAGLLAIAVLMLTIATYFGDTLARGGHSPSTEKLEIVLANQVLHVPANTIRFPNQRASSVHSRLDLYLHWPTLSGYTDQLKEDFNHAGEAANIIFITIEPRNMSFDMSGRLGPIYSMFLEGEPQQTPTGLARQPLSEASGFIDEDLYYQQASPYPFVTRCVRENSAIGTPFCIRDIHLGHDLMITYRFHKGFLKDWIALEEAVRNHAQRLLVTKTGQIRQ